MSDVRPLTPDPIPSYAMFMLIHLKAKLDVIETSWRRGDRSPSASCLRPYALARVTESHRSHHDWTDFYPRRKLRPYSCSQPQILIKLAELTPVESWALMGELAKASLVRWMQMTFCMQKIIFCPNGLSAIP